MFILTKRENINRNEHLSYLNNHNALNDTLFGGLYAQGRSYIIRLYENDMKKRDVCVCNRFLSLCL